MTIETAREFAQRSLIFLALATLFLAMIFFFRATWNILFLAFLGLLLATFWRSISSLLVTYLRLPDKGAVVVTLVLLIAILVALAVWFIPAIAVQGEEFVASLPQITQQAERFIVGLPLGDLLIEQLPEPDELGPPEALFGQVVDFATATGSVVIDLVLILSVAVFLAFTPEMYRGGVLTMLPKSWRPRGREVLDASGDALKMWIIGRFIAMLFVGVGVTLGLWALGIPLALFLGFLAFLLDFVPYIGPIIAAVPAILIALVDDPTTALYVVLLFFVLQQVESYVVGPVIYHRTIHLPPVLTIIALFVFGEIFGLLGLLVATPLFAVLLVIIRMLYVEDALQDPDSVKV